MLKGIRKRISRRKQEHDDTLVATNASVSDDRDSSQDGTVATVVTPTKEPNLGNDQSNPVAAIYQLAQSTDDDDDIYEASSVSSDERENHRKPASSPNAVFIQDELEALRIRQLARNLRKDLQEIECQGAPQLVPLATSATEAFYLKQREQNKEWKKKQKDSRTYLTSYRGPADSRKDDSIRTKKYSRSHALSTGSASPMDKFYLQQRAMNQEWKQKQRDANAYLHSYRGYILDKSTNGVSYEDLLVRQKQAAAIPLPPSPRSDLDTIGDMAIDGIGPLPTLRLDDKAINTFAPGLVPLKPRSAQAYSPAGQENMVPSTTDEKNIGDDQKTKKEAIVVGESADTDMHDSSNAEVINDDNEKMVEDAGQMVNTGFVSNEDFRNNMAPSEMMIGIGKKGEGIVCDVSPSDITDPHMQLATTAFDIELNDQSSEICTTDTRSIPIIHEEERDIIDMVTPSSTSLTHLSHGRGENEEMPLGLGNFNLNKNCDDKGLAPSKVEPHSTEVGDEELEEAEVEDFVFKNEVGCFDEVDDFDNLLHELLGDNCSPKGAAADREMTSYGRASQVEVSADACIVSAPERTSKIPTRNPSHMIVKARSKDCPVTPNKVDEFSKAASRRAPNVFTHPRNHHLISSLNVDRAPVALLRESETPSRVPPRTSAHSSNVVSPHVIRTPIPRTTSPTRSVSSTASARSSHRGSYRSPRFSGHQETLANPKVNGCTGKLVLDLHGNIDGCDNCLAFTTPAERLQFQQDGHHYRVNRVRGGCSRSCTVFPRNDNEPPVRLCRQCFYGTHYKRTPTKTA